jgi:hypothetical protein
VAGPASASIHTVGAENAAFCGAAIEAAMGISVRKDSRARYPSVNSPTWVGACLPDVIFTT